jgi:peptidoglycan hydrolase-like protein with peptidoglycan-binding domain
MAITGVREIDALLAGQSAAPLTAQTCTPEATGFLQDLLIGHDFNLPGPLAPARGRFGPQTTAAIRQFQRARHLPVTGSVDSATLRAMTAPGWPNPIACCGYVALVLDIAHTGMASVVTFVSQCEGAGRFAAMNRNTDRAGLSFGLIQWAQKPLRLHELLRAFQQQEADAFAEVFGDGDVALANGLLDHTGRKRGGTTSAGATTDSSFDLTRAPWTNRFRRAGRDLRLQRVQMNLAIDTFTRSFQQLQISAPEVQSTRGIAFLLDVANQHGDAGAASIVTAVREPGQTEADLLRAIENESVRRVARQFGAGSREAVATRNRRAAFRTTTQLAGPSLPRPAAESGPLRVRA